jgi:hypothetical protein
LLAPLVWIGQPCIGCEQRRALSDRASHQGWLGHRSITSTAVYTALAPNRFKDFWQV